MNRFPHALPEGTPFEEIDIRFAGFLSRITDTADPHRFLAAAMVSMESRRGHVCLNLADAAGSGDASEEENHPRTPPIDVWVESLRGWEAVGHPGEFAPLVLDGANRLYLHRFWLHEARVAAFFSARTARRAEGVCLERLGDGLSRLFPPDTGDGTDWQKVAAYAALRGTVSVITGGAGTGKTSTVAKILVLLLEQAGGSPFDAALAAPTGKAAARLKAAVLSARESLDCSAAVRERIPVEAHTLHRLLGARGEGESFRYGEERRLPYDAVVVDEASMVDLPMMSRLVSSLADGARLILLGDRDQLASVEPGAVFADLCDAGHLHGFSASFIEEYRSLAGDGIPDAEEGGNTPGLDDAIVVLRRSRRFREEGGIGALARAVKEGDEPGALALLESDDSGEIGRRDVPSPESFAREMGEAAVEGYSPLVGATDIVEAFAAFDRFRILCARRTGPLGADALNRIVIDGLVKASLVRPRGRYFRGQPVMVTRNDYRLRLFNGDVGLLWPDPRSGGELAVHFREEDGSFRVERPARVPGCETVFAMTVHKSQGSEFDRIFLVLDAAPTDVLTRELLYTGITRARERVTIIGTCDIIGSAVRRRTGRRSGLKDRLWGVPP